jgi:hypothetical protein
MKARHRYDSWLTEKANKAIPAITRNIDHSILRGMMALLDAQTHEQ